VSTTHPMQLTFDELRRSRRHDPATSKDSAARAHGLASEHRHAILSTLRASLVRERGPLAPHEIASLCGLSSVQVSRRLKELADDGLIFECGVADTPSGRSARTWRATQ